MSLRFSIVLLLMLERSDDLYLSCLDVEEFTDRQIRTDTLSIKTTYKSFDYFSYICPTNFKILYYVRYMLLINLFQMVFCDPVLNIFKTKKSNRQCSTITQVQYWLYFWFLQLLSDINKLILQNSIKKLCKNSMMIQQIIQVYLNLFRMNNFL